MNRKLLLSIILGCFLSAGMFWLAFKNIPAADLWHYMGTVNYLWIIPAVLISVTSFLLRVVRWQIILKTSAPVSFISSYHPLMTGFMLNCILPGRIGEIARPAILTRREGVPFTTGLATIVSERVFDLISLVILFALLLSSIEIDPSLEISAWGYKVSATLLDSVFSGMIIMCLTLVTGMAVISISKTRNLLTACILKIPDILLFLKPENREFIKSVTAPVLIRLISNISSGFRLINHPSTLIKCFILSFLIWMIQALSYHILTMACPGVTLSYTETITVMIIICFFIALPSVPGFWGLWEAGGIFALALFSVARESAAGYTLINHAVQIIPVIVIGMISALIIGINYKQLYKPEPPVTIEDS